MVRPIFSRRLKLLACRPRFSEGSPANTLEALPCVLLPPCYCKLPCHWILLTISHPNHHRSWKASHFEVRTREVVWAPPLRQVLRLSLRWKLGWICKSPRPEAFLDLLYDSKGLTLVWILKERFSVKALYEGNFPPSGVRDVEVERKCWSQLDIHLPVARGGSTYFGRIVDAELILKRTVPE